MIGELDAKIPAGPIAEKWSQHKFDVKLVNPANKRRFEIIVVGSGLAGAAAAATLGELGYRVKLFTFHDSPRRAHSIAAQGGINAAKNYPNDGDSVYRLFYDTVKGGDFRAREGNVYRLAAGVASTSSTSASRRACRSPASTAACSTTGRSAARRCRAPSTRGARPASSCCSARTRRSCTRCTLGTVELHTRTEMLDLVVKDGARRRHRHPRPHHRRGAARWSAHAVVLRTGGYGNAFYLSTNAKASNVTAAWRAHKRGALFANPCFTQIHPTCIPRERRLPVEAHADVGVVAQRRPGLGPEAARRHRGRPTRSPTTTATTSSSAATPRSATSCRATSRHVRSSARSTPAAASGRRRTACTSTSPSRSSASATTSSRSATATSSRCTSASPTRTRTRCRCGSTPPSTTRWAGSGSTTTS